jgi:hypothetical protein
MRSSNRLWWPLNSDDPTLALALVVVGVFLAVCGLIIFTSFAIPILLVLGIAKAIHWYTTLPPKTSELMSAVEAVRVRADFPNPHDYFEAFSTRYEKDCKQAGVTPAGFNTLYEILTLVMKIYEQEELHATPSPLRAVIEGSVAEGEYRDHLLEKAKKAENPAQTLDVFTRALSSAFVGFTTCIPALANEEHDKDRADGKQVTVRLFDMLGDETKQAVQYLIAPFFKTDAVDLNLFTPIRAQLQKNLDEIDKDKEALPTKFKGTNLETVDAYLKFTPLLDIFAAQIPWSLPEQYRFEHQWIVAPQGAGKTQLIQYQLVRDIEEAVKGNASVVVMDSQGDLIKLISELDGIPADRLCIIEPDPAFPIALNLFDIGKSRIETYDERTREMLDNNALELLTYVFDTLLGTATTAKQTALFRHAIRLCRAIPDATIHTLSDILNMDHVPHPEYVAALPKASRDFFETLFVDKKQFAQTKQEVAWRLSLMLENSTFERMFSQTKSKIDLFTELNSSKVILINTDKSLLKDQGTELFGRFFIAMLLQASQERALISRAKRLPTYVYIDECQDYIAHDTNVTIMLDQARKMNVGMVLAHQRTAQLDKDVLDALTNVSIKCARAVNDSGAHVLARNMATTPEFISKQPVGHFAIALRNNPAVSIQFPAFVMENMDRISEDNSRALKARMREKYAVAHASVPKPPSPAPFPPGPPPQPFPPPPPQPVPPMPKAAGLQQIPEADINSPPERPTNWPMV